MNEYLKRRRVRKSNGAAVQAAHCCLRAPAAERSHVVAAHKVKTQPQQLCAAAHVSSPPAFGMEVPSSAYTCKVRWLQCDMQRLAAALVPVVYAVTTNKFWCNN